MALARGIEGLGNRVSGVTHAVADRLHGIPTGEVNKPASVFDATKLQRDLDTRGFTTLPRGTTAQLSVMYQTSSGENNHAFLGKVALQNDTRVRLQSSSSYKTATFWLDSQYRTALESQRDSEKQVVHDRNATIAERARAKRRVSLLNGALLLVEGDLVDDTLEGRESMLKGRGKGYLDIDPNSVLDANLTVATTETVFPRKR
jgi:hypothetical protein